MVKMIMQPFLLLKNLNLIFDLQMIVFPSWETP